MTEVQSTILKTPFKIERERESYSSIVDRPTNAMQEVKKYDRGRLLCCCIAGRRHYILTYKGEYRTATNGSCESALGAATSRSSLASFLQVTLTDY